MFFIVFPSNASHSLPANVKFQLWKEDATTAAITDTLPDATRCAGTCICVVKADASANTVTVTPNGTQKILTTSGLVSSIVLSAQGKSITLVSDGGQWLQIASV